MTKTWVWLLLAAAAVGCSGKPEPTGGVAGGSGEVPGMPAQPGAAGSQPDAAGSGGNPGTAPSDAGGATGGPIAAAPRQPSLIGDVQFSLPSQTFRDSLSVGMSVSIAGAEIRYTTDGKLPDAAAQLYAGAPLALQATTQLRAQAFVQGTASGKPSSALYIARSFDFQSDLPILIIDGYGAGKPMNKELYLDAALMLFEPTEGSASIAIPPKVATRAGYHLRGQSSQRLPQTPYRLELWNNANEDQDYALVGMPADSDWALIPPYYDRSLIRNPFVYDLGRAIGLRAPRVRFVEVYINYEARPLAAGDYLGVYWLTETIKNNRDRIDLEQLREADTTLPAIGGGYIFKFDQAAAEEPKLACTGSPPLPSSFGMGMGTRPPAGGDGGTGRCWIDLEVIDPEPLVPEQAAWLGDYVQRFHDALQRTPIGDYASFIDVASFVDYLIINELTRNVDAYVRSAYYHKDRDGKLFAGPLWDYNFSLAVGGASSVDPAGGWQFQGSRNVNDWYPKLTADPAFMARVKTRWAELRGGLLSDAALAGRIDQLIAPLTAAAVRDYAKWRVADILKPNAFVRGPAATTWQGQVQALRDFVRARCAWMDEQLR